MGISRPCAFLLMAALFSVNCGCAKKDTQPPAVTADYYPACHEPLAYLKQRHNSTGTSAARGAIQGGVISGIASAIIGAIAGGIRPVGILVGTGVGATIGGATSAMASQSATEREDNRKLAEYLEQIDGDINGMDITRAAATVSMQCYGKEFKLLANNMQSMPREAAEKRFREILAGREEAAQLLKTSPETSVYEKEFSEAAARAYGKKP